MLKRSWPAGYIIEQEPKMEGRQMAMVVVMGKAQKQIEKQEKIDAKNED